MQNPGFRHLVNCRSFFADLETEDACEINKKVECLVMSISVSRVLFGHTLQVQNTHLTAETGGTDGWMAEGKEGRGVDCYLWCQSPSLVDGCVQISDKILVTSSPVTGDLWQEAVT